MTPEAMAWLLDQMSDETRERFLAHMREAVKAVTRFCEAVERWEAAGIAAAEAHANGDA